MCSTCVQVIFPCLMQRMRCSFAQLESCACSFSSLQQLASSVLRQHSFLLSLQMDYIVTCRNSRSPRHQPSHSHPQVHDEGLSVYSTGLAPHFFQGCGHSQWRSVYFQVSLTSSVHAKHQHDYVHAACNGTIRAFHVDNRT